jgi:hypothetical protein
MLKNYKFRGLLLFTAISLLSLSSTFAQVGIGTETPAASAALEVTSSTNNKGILIPRITATQKDAINNPVEGLMIYQTSAPAGFYYYTGTAWKLMAIQTDLASKVDKVDGKDLSTNDYTSAEKIKLATLTGAVDQTNITGNAGTATKLAASKNINGVAFDGSSDITIATGASAEQLTGTTLKSTVTASGLTSVGTLANLIVTNPIAGSVIGNAGTATKLAASKTINGVAFDGSSDITITAAAETLSGTTLKSTVTGSGLTSVGTLTNLTVTNPIAGSVTGNAGTATKLAAVININGVAFDGSSDITIASAAAAAAAETLTGTTLKSTVKGSGLTSVGTLTNLTVTNPIAGSVTGSADNVRGVVAVANGGSGASSLTGYIKGNGTSAFTTLSKIPVTDITAAVQKVNGNTPDANGNVILAFGNVTTGTLASRPLLAGTNGDIYVISGDATVAENGRTYISDGTAWNEVTSNQAATDARYVKLSGSTMVGNVTFPSGTKATMVDAPSSSTDLVNKTYVDAQATAAITADASGSSKGKIKLAGDLTGTADLPSIANNAILTSKILDGNVTDAKIASLSASKLTGSVAPANGGTGLTAVGTNGQVLTSDGTSLSWSSPAATGMTSLNGSTASSQTFAAPGTAGLAPAWSSASGTHTLNIPLAASTSVTAGLLSKADYDNFSAAYTNRITSVTTTGASGAATLVSNVLNIPTPSLDELAGTKAMNRVYAGPVSGADAIPTFRALVAADFPIMNQNTSGNAATATTATTATNVSGTVAVANGGTGATTLTGLVKANGTSAMTAAVAGTDYLAPTGSAALLTSWPTLNQNTSGNAATATLATTATTTTNVSGTVAVANGGTGAITLTGLVKGNGTGTMTAAVAGTDYLAPDGSAVNLTNFPVLNQNTSGNASTATLATTATTAGNVSGTVAVANGGTGATTLTGLVKGNGTGTMTAAVAGTDYLEPNGSAALLTSWPILNQNTSGNAATATLATTATTSTNIAGGLGGSIPYQTASNRSAMLANGTNGQVLTSQGTTLAPVWAAAASSGVPYSGATSNLDLGVRLLTVQDLTIGLGGGAVSGNTAFGYYALTSNLAAAYNNNAIGIYTLMENTTGLNNTGLGAQAGRYNKTGSDNTSIGSFAMHHSTGVGSNTAVGREALYSTTSGHGNTSIGFGALATNTTGTYNTGLGYGSKVASGALTNATAIGYNASVDVSNTMQLGNASVTDVKTSGTITAGVVTYPKAHGTANQVLTTSGTALTWSTASSGVPYTGANAQVDLGAYALKLQGITVGVGAGANPNNTAFGNNALISNASSAYYNNAIGLDALRSNTSGIDNTGLGAFAGRSNTIGNSNTSIGSSAMYYSIGTGFNTAVGMEAMKNTTSGSYNVSIGSKSLLTNVTGSNNTVLGSTADVATAALSNATAIGYGAVVDATNKIQLGNTSVTAVNTSGAITGLSFIKSLGTAAQFLKADGTVDGSTYLTSASTATRATNIAGGDGGSIPYQTAANTSAMLANGTSGYVLTSQGTTLAPVWAAAASGGVPYTGATGAVDLGAFDLTVNELTVGKGNNGIATNTAIGYRSLSSNTTGQLNTAIGFENLYKNTTGQYNTANGYQSLYSNITGNHNTATGGYSLFTNISGSSNTANGRDALHLNTTGSDNTGNGYQTLYNNTSGYSNTANGSKSGSINITGFNNTFIGKDSDVTTAALNNATAIGYNAKVDASNTIQLGNTNVTAVKTSGAIIGGNTATSTISGFAANMNAQTGTTYTLLASDNGKIITLTNAAAITLSVPTLFAGFNCMIVQLGAGAVTLTVSGTTISNRSTFTKTAGTNAIATLIALTSTTFISAGDMQ